MIIRPPHPDDLADEREAQRRRAVAAAAGLRGHVRAAVLRRAAYLARRVGAHARRRLPRDRDVRAALDGDPRYRRSRLAGMRARTSRIQRRWPSPRGAQLLETIDYLLTHPPR